MPCTGSGSLSAVPLGKSRNPGIEELLGLEHSLKSLFCKNMHFVGDETEAY